MLYGYTAEIVAEHCDLAGALERESGPELIAGARDTPIPVSQLVRAQRNAILELRDLNGAGMTADDDRNAGVVAIAATHHRLDTWPRRSAP